MSYHTSEGEGGWGLGVATGDDLAEWELPRSRYMFGGAGSNAAQPAINVTAIDSVSRIEIAFFMMDTSLYLIINIFCCYTFLDAIDFNMFHKF